MLFRSTGYLRAMANLGRTKKGTIEEIFNYAIGESQETGSTFKLASFLVALEDGKVDLTTPINCSNGMTTFSGRKMEDSHHGLGVIPALQVFEKSSNVGTSKMIYAAYADDPQKYIDGLYLHQDYATMIGTVGNQFLAKGGFGKILQVYIQRGNYIITILWIHLGFLIYRQPCLTTDTTHQSLTIDALKAFGE